MRAKGKLRRLGKKLDTVQARIKIDEAEASELKAEMLTTMKDLEVIGKVDAGDGVVVERVVKKGRKTLSVELLIAGFPDLKDSLDEYRVEGKGSDYVTVTVNP